MAAPTAQPWSFLATGRGKITLALLCAVTFLDVVDGSIVNVALPTIRTHLGFSVQNLQWVVSGYLITYGGFLLLGGPGRRPARAAAAADRRDRAVRGLLAGLRAGRQPGAAGRRPARPGFSGRR